MINHTFLDTYRPSNSPRLPRLSSRRLDLPRHHSRHKVINQENAHGTIAREAPRKIISMEEARMATALSSNLAGEVPLDQEGEMAMMTTVGSSSRDHNSLCL